VKYWYCGILSGREILVDKLPTCEMLDDILHRHALSGEGPYEELELSYRLVKTRIF
jgi:hypothetical protein